MEIVCTRCDTVRLRERRQNERRVDTEKQGEKKKETEIILRKEMGAGGAKTTNKR